MSLETRFCDICITESFYFSGDPRKYYKISSKQYFYYDEEIGEPVFFIASEELFEAPVLNGVHVVPLKDITTRYFTDGRYHYIQTGENHAFNLEKLEDQFISAEKMVEPFPKERIKVLIG